MKGSFIRNLETGKTELHFAKADYLALSDAQKSSIKSACLFSGRQGCWVSRATHNDWRALQVAQSLGLEDGGETGARLTFAEQQVAKVERAEERAERMELHAENAERRAAVAFDRADLSEGKSGIPFGQPILVGHHSERRHRRAIERADNAMRKSIEESDKAKYFAGRAASAAYTASRADLADKRYLQNRIDENAAQIRDVDRRIKGRGHPFQNSNPEAFDSNCSICGGKARDCVHEVEQPSDEYKARLAALRVEYQEKLEYFQVAMAALGGVTYSRDNVKAGDLVKIRGDWRKVVKANGKTVAAASCFPWPLKYPWAEVQGHKPAVEDNICPDGPACPDPVCREERRKIGIEPTL